MRMPLPRRSVAQYCGNENPELDDCGLLRLQIACTDDLMVGGQPQVPSGTRPTFRCQRHSARTRPVTRMPKVGTARMETIPALAEVFREHGYEGASLPLLGKATGLGKGSLYNFFPNGKEEMLAAVLGEIDDWFESNVFATLRGAPDPACAVRAMFDSVDDYFRSGRRACLISVLAPGDARDRFAGPVRAYFARWVATLTGALTRSGRADADAAALAKEVIAGIQGAPILARALDDPDAFGRTMARLRAKTVGPAS